jgi:hypothetical protein
VAAAAGGGRDGNGYGKGEAVQAPLAVIGQVHGVLLC